MSKTRKGIGLLLAVLMLLGVCINGTAAGNGNTVFELISFGILPEGTVSGTETPVLREQLADMTAKMLQIDQVGDAGVTFRDVDRGNQYYDSIGVVAALGIMRGDETGMFRPGDAVSYQEAVKVLVCLLGYDYKAQNKGGYPMGYLTVAGELGLLSGAGSTEMFTADQLYMMFGNALDVPVMKQITGSGEFEIDKDDTFRKQLQEGKDGTLYHGKGIVEATYYDYLERPVTSIRADEVMIEGKLFETGTTNAADFFGRETEFYAKEDDNGVFTLVSIKPARTATVMTVTDDMFAGMDGRTLYYYTGEKREKLTVAEDFRYLYNKVPQSGYSHGEITVKSGSLTLIDNDGDLAYDVVLREEYDSVRVESVVNGRIYYKSGTMAAGESSLLIDETDSDMKYMVRGAQGNGMKPEEIQADMVLSVMANEYKTLYQIIVSDQMVEGTVQEISAEEDQEITIADNVYPVAYGAVIDVKVGDTVKAYLNERGQIVDVDQDSSTGRYAYVVQAGQKGGMGNWQLKLLDPGKLTMEYDINDSDPDNVKKTPFLKGRNSNVLIIDVAPGVSVNGSKPSGGLGQIFQDPANCVITYRLNAKGEISNIEFPERIGTGDKRKYNGYERTFGGYGMGVFGTDDETKVICVPENGPVRDEDYRAEVEINNNSQYKAVGFDLGNDLIADLVVLTIPMKYDNVVEINESKDKIAVATAVKSVVGEDEESVREITFLSEGQEKKYRVADSAANAAKNMAVGDVFFYTLNPVGEIGKIKMMQKLLPQPSMRNDGSIDTTEGKYMLGKVNSVEYGLLDDIGNRFVDRVNIWFDDMGIETYSLEISKRTPPAVYVVDANAKTVRVGTREDLASWTKNGQYIFVRASDSKIRGIVLVSY